MASTSPNMFVVPTIDRDEGGPAYLDGAFNVGEGKYHVDWLMRDRAERMCSFHWDSEANLPPKDKQMNLDIAAGNGAGARLGGFQTGAAHPAGAEAGAPERQADGEFRPPGCQASPWPLVARSYLA
ncbi:MAG: hypothetical protein WDO73_31360 [Ignavibacteriota bacterium]